jgi:hypothetical protein
MFVFMFGNCVCLCLCLILDDFSDCWRKIGHMGVRGTFGIEIFGLIDLT